MREILFRGKRIDNGEWVHGNLIQRNLWGAVFPIIRVEDKGYGNFKEWEVIPETVGQYTGLDDKNGVKIFDGDVFHWDSHWGWYVGYENGAFRRIPLDAIQRMNWEHYPLKQECLETWENIGNIHDNPEVKE